MRRFKQIMRRVIESKQLFGKSPKHLPAQCDANGDSDDESRVGFGNNPVAVADWLAGGEDAFLDSLDLSDRREVVEKLEAEDDAAADEIFLVWGYAVSPNGQVAEHFGYHAVIGEDVIENSYFEDPDTIDTKTPCHLGLRKAIIKKYGSSLRLRNLRLCCDGQTSSKKRRKHGDDRRTIRKILNQLKHPTRTMYDLAIFYA